MKRHMQHYTYSLRAYRSYALAVIAALLTTVGLGALAFTSTAQTAHAANPPVEVIFAIDESGSMGPDINDVKNQSTFIANELGDTLDPQFGLWGYGATASHRSDASNGDPHKHRDLTNLSGFQNGLNELVAGGGIEPGMDAIEQGMNNTQGFREGAGACFVAITDEPSNGDSASVSDAINALNAKDATFFGIVNSNNKAKYQQVADATGGATFSITDFRSDAQPVLQELIDKCTVAVTQGITLEPQEAENDVGEDHTVTATITNNQGDPVENTEVTFEVISGPNSGVTGTSTTDANGEATFTYTGTGGTGTDTIEAEFEDQDGNIQTATAEKTWVNAPPQITDISGDSINEGGTATVTVSFDDQDQGDTHDIEYVWGGTGSVSSFSDVNSPFSATEVYGDNGTFEVEVTVTDDAGASDSATATVNVANLDPDVTLDTSGAVSFPGGDAFVGNVGVEQSHSADVSDPGSDDETFTWSFGPSTTYFNDTGDPSGSPDPLPSPLGTFPFTAADTASFAPSSAGAMMITVTADDDDTGSDVDQLPKIVFGDRQCTRTQGFWRHQFSDKGKQHIDDATLKAHLSAVNAASGYFSEETAAGTLTEANDVFSKNPTTFREKAERQLLAAWLNLTSGAVGWNEDVGGMTAGDRLTKAEQLLNDPNATHAEIEDAKDHAEAINTHDGEQCSEEEGKGNENGKGKKDKGNGNRGNGNGKNENDENEDEEDEGDEDTDSGDDSDDSDGGGIDTGGGSVR